MKIEGNTGIKRDRSRRKFMQSSTPFAIAVPCDALREPTRPESPPACLARSSHPARLSWRGAQIAVLGAIQPLNHLEAVRFPSSDPIHEPLAEVWYLP